MTTEEVCRKKNGYNKTFFVLFLRHHFGAYTQYITNLEGVGKVSNWLYSACFLLQFSEYPDPILCSDYVQLSNGPLSSDQKYSTTVSWEELKSMELPSFEPAFLVLCRVLLNVIHECLKLRLEQRPAGEPSLLSIKQVCLMYFFLIYFTLFELYRRMYILIFWLSTILSSSIKRDLKYIICGSF